MAYLKAVKGLKFSSQGKKKFFVFVSMWDIEYKLSLCGNHFQVYGSSHYAVHLM